MNNNYQNEITAIIQQAQREIIYNAIDAIQERNDKMMKLLVNGRGIFQQTTGDRFSNMYAQRNKLWMKIKENRKSIYTLCDIANTQCVKC